MRRRATAMVATALVSVSGLLVSCADVAEVTECGDRIAVALMTQTVREGADVVGSTDGARLSVDLESTLAVLDAASQTAPSSVGAEIEVLAAALVALRDALESRGWDLQGIAGDDAVQVALDAIDRDEVQIANVVVESYLTAECGAATADVAEDSVATLPTPTGLVPVEDEPLTGAADNESDALALGSIVALSYGLDLTSDQLECLGRELQNVVDLSDETSSTAAYLRQFQKAFDACEIEFRVPVE